MVCLLACRWALCAPYQYIQSFTFYQCCMFPLYFQQCMLTVAAAAALGNVLLAVYSFTFHGCNPFLLLLCGRSGSNVSVCLLSFKCFLMTMTGKLTAQTILFVKREAYPSDIPWW